MRIMVMGASGFIGRHVMAEFLAEKHEVVGAVRTIGNLPQAFPEAQFLRLDLAKSTNEQEWRPHLRGIDCIVNAAGILQGSQIEDIHVTMPEALHKAAVLAGVKHVVLISAISAREDVVTDYSCSKLAGENALRASGLDWTILRPSLVYGDGSYGGTSLMRGIAGLPFFIPLPGNGDFTFTPIHAGDLARSTVRLCGDNTFFGKTLEPVGPDTFSLKQILGRYRSWLGFGFPHFLKIPMPVMRFIARIGDITGDGPIATNSLSQLVAGNAGDSTAYSHAIGFLPRSLDDALLSRPAQVQDSRACAVVLSRACNQDSPDLLVAGFSMARSLLWKGGNTGSHNEPRVIAKLGRADAYWQ